MPNTKTVAEHMRPRTLTLAEFRAEAEARFGPDPADWAFECPRCGDVATGADFRGALDALAASGGPRRHHADDALVTFTDIFGQECIGRTTGALDGPGDPCGRGCNWAAYGLVPAPWAVTRTDGETVYCFPLALAPAPVPTDG